MTTDTSLHSSPSSPRQAGAACHRARHRVCPWWLGHLLASPLRRLLEKPERLLGPLVRPGMTVLEPGCGMGFFTLPLARMVGPHGHVVCVDVQPEMIDGLRRRARRAGLEERIHALVCEPTGLGLAEWASRVDLAVAIHMVHEVPDQAAFLRELHGALKTGGRLFIREPGGHVSPQDFEATLAAAEREGFTRVSHTVTKRVLSAVLAG